MAKVNKGKRVKINVAPPANKEKREKRKVNRLEGERVV